jgi:hypothetical protein
MSSAEGLVVPNPGIPRTLGILNIIFGTILALAGCCLASFTAGMPMLIQFGQEAQKKVQADLAEQRKAELKKLDDQIAAAKTDEEKKPIEAEKAAEIARADLATPPDMSAITDLYKNPTIMGFNLTFYGSGFLMNLLLLISGIGLVKLASWSRTMALGLATLQLARIILLTGVCLIVVQPESIKATNKMISNLEAQAQAQGKGKAAPINPAQNLQAAKAMGMMGSFFIVGYALVASIYPIVTLILLNGSSAKAACQPRKSLDSRNLLS